MHNENSSETVFFIVTRGHVGRAFDIGDHELAFVAGLRAGCLGHNVSCFLRIERNVTSILLLATLLMPERMDVSLKLLFTLTNYENRHKWYGAI